MSVSTKPADRAASVAQLGVYFLMGVFFGIVLIKSEVVSWFRIQEMFRFQSFHMYGVIGSAVAVAAASIRILKRMNVQSATGEALCPRVLSTDSTKRYWIGGLIFGFGWALTGACPGPIFALAGYGITIFTPVLLSAVAGAWVYGMLAPRLPH